MKKQSYRHHTRFHPIYHFFLLPITGLFGGLSAYFFVQTAIEQGEWAKGLYYLLAGLVAGGVVVLVRTTPLKLQDRLIRTEVRLRYLAATGTHLNGAEKTLRTSQLLALRFASDEELPRLVDQAAQEDLSPADIKKRIRKWKGDHHRI